MDKVVKIILDAKEKIWSLDNEYCSRNDITDDGKTMMKHIHWIYSGYFYTAAHNFEMFQLEHKILDNA